MSRARHLSPTRAAALRPVLDRFQRGYDAAGRIGFDPVELPRRYADPGDAEVAGLLAASLAYGRADLFKPRLEVLLAAMGDRPARFAEALARRPEVTPFAGFQYRFNQPEDVAALLAAAGHVRLAHGSIGARFAALLEEERHAGEQGPGEPLRRALSRLSRELREAPPVAGLLHRRGRRGLFHLLPDAALPGACKRWNLYLRWMVRGPDGVDMGLWRGVPPAALVIPLDTHVARIARYLGLTDRSDLTWRTAAEITGNLRLLDPADPVRFDFALCHLGMSGACPPRRVRAKCTACPLREHCRARARSGQGDPGAAPARPSAAR